MTSLVITTPPATLPVSVADVSLHLRLNDSSEDDLIEAWIWAAADLFARHTGHVLSSTTFTMYLDNWPHAYRPLLYLPVRPVTEVASVEYLDENNAWIELEGWSADLNSTPVRLNLPTSLPTTHTIIVPVVRVVFTAGHTLSSGDDPPHLAVTATKLLASHWYAQRESHTDVDLRDVPLGWKHIATMFDHGVRGEWNNESW